MKWTDREDCSTIQIGVFEIALTLGKDKIWYYSCPALGLLHQPMESKEIGFAKSQAIESLKEIIKNSCKKLDIYLHDNPSHYKWMKANIKEDLVKGGTQSQSL